MWLMIFLLLCLILLFVDSIQCGSSTYTLTDSLLCSIPSHHPSIKEKRVQPVCVVEETNKNNGTTADCVDPQPYESIFSGMPTYFIASPPPLPSTPGGPVFCVHLGSDKLSPPIKLDN